MDGEELAARIAVEEKSSGGSQDTGDPFAVGQPYFRSLPNDVAGLDIEGTQVFSGGLRDRTIFLPTAGSELDLAFLDAHDVVEARYRAEGSAVPIGRAVGAGHVAVRLD